ncbi:GNAT family N-acetyltransferase [Nocardioides sp. LHD-245]|uniref:GNAT family N-acetyltransferase n=1 Tax=Nocardioides sp. LHD-245 TaxID=3051387 RepID=UPI0027E1ECD3|nr:GNAT family N-acetyltransferase [Nocardioides sp. LHD-245]
MPDAQRPPDLGRHLLGPHVVGQRVVVRRLLRGRTGPSGGPALTDVLGVCLSWAEGTCVVQPASGEPVRIALADIVSGKPVPPRPAPRLRVSARDAEARTGGLWATVDREPLGAWELRSEREPTGRLLKRANSCLAMGDPGRPFPEALAAVEAFYAGRGRDPLAQVEAGSALEESFAAAGWQRLSYGESELLLASVARLRRSLTEAGARTGATADVELTVTGARAVASAGAGCDPLAEARAGVDGDWVGLHGLTVDPAHRRRGLATTVVLALLDWAAEQGAMTAWLHVETDNPDGRAFWEALGFVTHHTCRYYAPSSASAWPVNR